MDFLPAVLRRGRKQPVHVEDGMSDSTLQAPPTTGRRPIVPVSSFDQSLPGTSAQKPEVIPPDDQLAIFRHLVGIHSTRSFGTVQGGQPDLTHNNLQFDGRAAPNLGIYNRVCHREQEAKRGYKFSAILINGCLGVQIVVAAALTAMGAANSGHQGVTAFGAINTVIAGILTYLKGSGLPMRLRYYENEWKKVREYIEQRERDFSRPNCPLNVYEVVAGIETMYEDVKADIQTNTPDSWVSVGDIRNRVTATNPQIPRLHGIGQQPKNKLHEASNKLQELEMKYGHKVTHLLEKLAQKEEERLAQLEKGVEANVESHIQEAGRTLEKDFEIGSSRVLGSARDLEKEMESTATRVQSAATLLEQEADRERANAARLGRELEEELGPHNRRPNPNT